MKYDEVMEKYVYPLLEAGHTDMAVVIEALMLRIRELSDNEYMFYDDLADMTKGMERNE